MSFYELKTKCDVVIVTKKSRGAFPGESSSKGTVGLVWSQWLSNEKFGSYKVSLLDKTGSITFTTLKCIEHLGNIDHFEDLQKAYNVYADEHFVPVFCHTSSNVRDNYLIYNKLWLRPLSKNKDYSVAATSLHPEDLKEVLENQDKNFFCLRLEPWVLKKWELI